VEGYRRRALERAKRYSWDAVADRYEALLRSVWERSRPGHLPPHLVDRDARHPAPVA
jgi:hypothetical protein